MNGVLVGGAEGVLVTPPTRRAVFGSSPSTCGRRRRTPRRSPNVAVTRAPPQGARSDSDRRTHGARLDAADNSSIPKLIDIPASRAQKCMKLVRVPVVRQMTIFERQLILLAAVTPQAELVHPTQFDYDRRAYVRAYARRARPATRARCRGTHLAPHPPSSPPTECTRERCGLRR